jgi:hypothetical protein
MAGRAAIERGDHPRAVGPIIKDLGSAVAAVWVVYKATLQDAFVTEWTLEQATTELSERLAVVSLGGGSPPSEPWRLVCNLQTLATVAQRVIPTEILDGLPVIF